MYGFDFNYLFSYFLIFMFFSGLLVFCSSRKHLLLTLISLEFLTLTLFLGFFYFLSGFGYEVYFCLVFLTFAVCEGALGLGVLVSLIRCHGNDNLNSISVISW
uniref:NADH-ubiquinone oxidoreductase chain 4L n=2 Tax=Belostomatinae TaxID=280091 RepID=A0A8K1JVG5_9HEMI|nr:NADH dehydrogenase subunit 4L [Diplonychus rusticus]UCU57421.1 NADH dehydrogenase subunit 4L [Appasus japonicus]